MTAPAGERDGGRRLLRVGLTGGIASGKSTVGGFLRDRGALVIDADRVVHELLEGDERVRRAVAERFGGEVLDREGRIDRRALGRIVFRDAAGRAALERAVHPVLRAELDRRIEDYRREGRGAPVAVVDAALLVETGAYRGFDRLIVVRCGRQTQLRRLRERDGLEHADAEARIASQAPLDAKLAVADYVIDTDTSIERTRERTAEVFRALLEDLDGMPPARE